MAIGGTLTAICWREQVLESFSVFFLAYRIIRDVEFWIGNGHADTVDTREVFGKGIRGKYGHGGIEDQFLKGIAFRLHEKFGVRHFFEYQVVPEPDVLKQEHVFPVHLLDVYGFPFGEAVLLAQVEKKVFFAQPVG